MQATCNPMQVAADFYCNAAGIRRYAAGGSLSLISAISASCSPHVPMQLFCVCGGVSINVQRGIALPLPSGSPVVAPAHLFRRPHLRQVTDSRRLMAAVRSSRALLIFLISMNDIFRFLIPSS